MTRSRRHSFANPRGVTLVELLIAMGILGVILASITGAVIAQRQVGVRVEIGRETLENGREALLEIEKGLRMAGFGIDPRATFDFAYFLCAEDDMVSGVDGRDICRDRRTAPDRLTFLARDPRYRIDIAGTNGCIQEQGCPTGQAWQMTARDMSNPPSITIDAREGQQFLAGRVLLVTCSTVARWSMVTVREAAEATADGPLTLRLYAAHGSDPTRENGLADACFGADPMVFAVDRRQYEIRDYDDTPWLVLNLGLDLDGDGNDPLTEVDLDDLLPIAPGIEDMQIAYVLNDGGSGTPPDTDGNGVVGDDPTALPEEPNHLLPAPEYRTGNNAPARFNLHPANIRAVRVSLVARSLRPDTSRDGEPLPQAENSTRELSDEARGEYQRFLVSTTVAIRNMSSRGMFTF